MIKIKLRFYSIKDFIVNIFLYLNYPWLFNNGFSPHNYLDCMPKGWKKNFGKKLCKEINNQLKRESPNYQYKVYKVREKNGELQWCDNSTSEIRNIVIKYIYLSREICEVCGKRASHIIEVWSCPVCPKCRRTLMTKRQYTNEDFRVI